MYSPVLLSESVLMITFLFVSHSIVSPNTVLFYVTLIDIWWIFATGYTVIDPVVWAYTCTYMYVRDFCVMLCNLGVLLYTQVTYVCLHVLYWSATRHLRFTRMRHMFQACLHLHVYMCTFRLACKLGWRTLFSSVLSTLVLRVELEYVEYSSNSSQVFVPWIMSVSARTRHLCLTSEDSASPLQGTWHCSSASLWCLFEFSIFMYSMGTILFRIQRREQKNSD